MATWQIPLDCQTVNLLGMEAYLMEIFGPWLPPLFGLGVVLLVGGLVVKQAASAPVVKRIGQGAVKGGSLTLLLAATMYLLILALAAVFENMLSNLPGA